MNTTNPFYNLEKGILLPKNNLFVNWGESFEDLSIVADRAESWLPHGETDNSKMRYGQLRWYNEDAGIRRSYGVVIGYVHGDPTIVRQFDLFAGDPRVNDKGGLYAMWKDRLTLVLGEPHVPQDERGFIAPPCTWKIGPVLVGILWHCFKGEEDLYVRLSHDAYPI